MRGRRCCSLTVSGQGAHGSARMPAGNEIVLNSFSSSFVVDSDEGLKDKIQLYRVISCLSVSHCFELLVAEMGRL